MAWPLRQRRTHLNCSKKQRSSRQLISSQRSVKPQRSSNQSLYFFSLWQKKTHLSQQTSFCYGNRTVDVFFAVTASLDLATGKTSLLGANSGSISASKHQLRGVFAPNATRGYTIFYCCCNTTKRYKTLLLFLLLRFRLLSEVFSSSTYTQQPNWKITPGCNAHVV